MLDLQTNGFLNSSMIGILILNTIKNYKRRNGSCIWFYKLIEWNGYCFKAANDDFI